MSNSFCLFLISSVRVMVEEWSPSIILEKLCSSPQLIKKPELNPSRPTLGIYAAECTYNHLLQNSNNGLPSPLTSTAEILHSLSIFNIRTAYVSLMFSRSLLYHNLRTLLLVLFFLWNIMYLFPSSLEYRLKCFNKQCYHASPQSSFL